MMLVLRLVGVRDVRDATTYRFVEVLILSTGTVGLVAPEAGPRDGAHSIFFVAGYALRASPWFGQVIQ